MNYLYRIALLTFISGALVYAYRHNWIIIRMPFQHELPVHALGADKKKVTISRYTKHGLVAEPQQMLWEEGNLGRTAERLTNAYLTLLYEENCIDQKIQLHGATTNSTNQELYLNFSHALVPEDAPLYEKWMVLEGLLKTIRENIPEMKSVRFLVNHKPLMDHDLDFSRPWPIEGFMAPAPTSFAATHKQRAELCTIMLEPAGDAQYTGRIIDDAFERGITLQCAQELKKILEGICKQTRVILSRFPGEVLEPLQNAAFANRLKTDLYISLSMYQLPASKSDSPAEINIYYFLYHPVTDFWQRATTELACEPYHQAHKAASQTSKACADKLFNNLHKTKPFAGKMNHCAGLPVKPLIGITAPSLLIEIGLPHKDSWQLLVTQLAQQIAEIQELI
ncbi:unnamed protein product [Sphagnum balticum]